MPAQTGTGLPAPGMREPTNQTDAASNRPLDIPAVRAQFGFAPNPWYSGRHYRQSADQGRAGRYSRGRTSQNGVRDWRDAKLQFLRAHWASLVKPAAADPKVAVHHTAREAHRAKIARVPVHGASSSGIRGGGPKLPRDKIMQAAGTLTMSLN
ncbi:hypothetical protein VTN96DRAFT_3681 [Rasamsonia emersonii]